MDQCFFNWKIRIIDISLQTKKISLSLFLPLFLLSGSSLASLSLLSPFLYLSLSPFSLASFSFLSRFFIASLSRQNGVGNGKTSIKVANIFFLIESTLTPFKVDSPWVSRLNSHSKHSIHINFVFCFVYVIHLHIFYI